LYWLIFADCCSSGVFTNSFFKNLAVLYACPH
jgi:hypothetical protein